jgi:hypothetical protein
MVTTSPKKNICGSFMIEDVSALEIWVPEFMAQIDDNASYYHLLLRLRMIKPIAGLTI